MMAATKTKRVAKSAKTGTFVPTKYLTKKPNETHQQTVKVGRKGGK